jgi:hypothetical protein
LPSRRAATKPARRDLVGQGVDVALALREVLQDRQSMGMGGGLGDLGETLVKCGFDAPA